MPSVQRILIQDYAGYPFPVSLSRALAARGHTVLHLYAGHNPMPRGNMQIQPSDPPTFAVQALYTREPLKKYAFIKRWRQEREYGYLAVQAAKNFAPNIVISADMPLDPQAILLNYCRKNRIRFIFWLQDIISLAAKSILYKKLSLPGAWIGTYYQNLEQKLLRQSDHIIAISADFTPFLLQARVLQDKITVIPNWAALDTLPVLPKDNDWARANGIADKFCFLYSGTLGFKHKPDLLLQLALHFRADPQVVVYVGSEGPGAAWLHQQKQQHNLANLILMQYQPLEILPQVLASADVLLAILEPDAGVYSVPSKVLSYLAARRPILLAVPPNNLAARIVRENHAGLVAHPQNTADWLQKAAQLRLNASLRQTLAANARQYAEDHFDIAAITNHFESTF